jgi:hypothetical protein
MGTPTFSSFNDVVRELEDVYGHQELWLYSGLNEDSPIETARRRQKWRSPKILKRNGRMVAEQSGQPDFWVLTVTTICRSLNTALRRGKPASSIRSLKCIVHC